MSEDWRNLANGRVIPTPGMRYCDQPYPVVLRNGTWLCMMTVGTLGENVEGSRNFTAVTLSQDQGQSWTPFESCKAPAYAVPLLTPFGRVYALTPRCFTYSDDLGQTWSEPVDIPVYPPDWSGWSVGMPLTHSGLAYLPWARVGLSHPPRHTEVYFHRSDNLLTELDPADLHWELLPRSGEGLKGPDWDKPEHRSEEPHIVALSDGTLYCVFRTDQGYIGTARSRDWGDTWTVPRALTYRPDGDRRIKHPLACPSLWACGDGRYLLFNHNHGGTTYADRNPAWVSGGLEIPSATGGRDLAWSEPEILLYSDDLTYHSGRISYPGFLQQGDRYWIFETQKTLTRLHEIPAALFEGLWGQHTASAKALAGCVLSWTADEGPSATVAAPSLPAFRHPWSNLDQWQGFSLVLSLNPALPDGEQGLLDVRDAQGEGWALLASRCGGVQLVMNDGQTENRWGFDPDCLDAGSPNHIVVIVDGGPKTIAFVVNGELWDGGSRRQYGWGRYSPNLRKVDGTDLLSIDGQALRALQIYDRPLRISEAVGLSRDGLAAKD